MRVGIAAQISLPGILEEPVAFRQLVKEIPSTTYATFALYHYPAKFIPQVIAYALKTYAHPGMSVFDPFAGYGTVGIVARLYGNPYELWDLNPLLEHLHAVAVMKPFEIDSQALVRQMAVHQEPFLPDWPNISHWYPEKFLPLLAQAWGFFHAQTNDQIKRLLLVPLLKTTRYFSYNDEKRQKLCRSKVSTERVEALVSQDWENLFFQKVSQGMDQVLKKLKEYEGLRPRPVLDAVRAGVDTLSMSLDMEHDLLITSPPYLQAQEYIRATKMDLFWLGYSQAYIKALGRKEIPYRVPPLCPIYSPTYYENLAQIGEPHLRKLFERYFSGVLGALTRLQENVRHHLLLFVGPATVQARPIPVARIFAEHFTALGWRHKATLVDTIVARTMFFYKTNPATGLRDERMSTEHLVILER